MPATSPLRSLLLLPGEAGTSQVNSQHTLWPAPVCQPCKIGTVVFAKAILIFDGFDKTVDVRFEIQIVKNGAMAAKASSKLSGAAASKCFELSSMVSDTYRLQVSKKAAFGMGSRFLLICADEIHER